MHTARTFFLVLATIIFLSVAYYFLFALPAQNRKILQLEREELEAVQKAKEEEGEATQKAAEETKIVEEKRQAKKQSGEFNEFVYKWIDEKGTIHFTDDLNVVPEKFKDKAKKSIDEFPPLIAYDKLGRPQSYRDIESESVDSGRPSSEDVPFDKVVFAAPPEVVVIPETEVYVAPSVPGELFFYDGYWWRPWHGRWYRSLYYDHGWAVYGGVPFWYRGIPHDWRENYRTHLWGGHPWSYHPIYHSDLQRNWKTWHNTNYWNQPEHRQFTHRHDGRPYSTAQTKPATGYSGKIGTSGISATPGKLEKRGTSSSQGKPGTGGISATQRKVEEGGHGTTGTRASTSDKHTTGQTKGGHTKETERKD